MDAASIAPAAAEPFGASQQQQQSAATATDGAVPLDSSASASQGREVDAADTAFHAVYSARAAVASASTEPSRLHLLNTSVQALHCPAPPASSSATASQPTAPEALPLPSSTASTSLSRQEFHSLISQIRQAASRFARESPALLALGQGSGDGDDEDNDDDDGPLQQQHQRQQQQQRSFAASATTNAVRRYVSLLGETSKHIAELRHSTDSFSLLRLSDRTSLAQSRIASATNPSLSALRSLASRQPASDGATAVEGLETLCRVLEAHARALGLETFAEKAEEAADLASGGRETLAHTLTIGAKILVIDVELVLLRGSGNDEDRLSPLVKLKLSYANDSDQPAVDGAATPARDPALAALLQRDVQAAAELLFGQQPAKGAAAVVEQVADRFARFSCNLEDLIRLDEIASRVHEAGLGANVDVFDAMQRLSAQVAAVTESERRGAAANASTDDEPTLKRLLLERGHGLATLHQQRPFVEVVYARGEASRVDYKLSLEVRPLDVPSAAAAASSSSSPLLCRWPLSSEAAERFEAVSKDADPSSMLGRLSVGGAQVPLRFVAQLDPPVVVSRATAAKLAAICGLAGSGGKVGAPANGLGSGPQGSPTGGAVWFEDVLSSIWSQRPAASDLAGDYRARCSFTLARTPESLRDPGSQGLIVDALPLLGAREAAPPGGIGSTAASSTVARLFAAIETLRDEVRATELAHSALSSSSNAGATIASGAEAERALSLDDLLDGAKATGSAPPATLPVVIVWRTTEQPRPGAGANVSHAPPQALVMDLGFTVEVRDPEQTRRPHLDVKISVCPASAAGAWSVEAAAVLRSGATLQSKKLPATDAEAQRFAELLLRPTPTSGSPRREAMSGLEALDRLAIGVVEWCQAQFGVEAVLPEAAPPQKRGETSSSTYPKDFDPLAYEEKNVHAVYETIAPHFSSTRYKPWPLIPLFLSTLPAGSLGADLGCGNGKYLPIRSLLAGSGSDAPQGGDPSSTAQSKAEQSLLTIGVDRSSNLLSLAQTNFGFQPSGADAKAAGSKQQQQQQQRHPQRGERPEAEAEWEEEARQRRLHEVAVGDAMMSSLRTGVFDFAISIATIHHFSTWERRVQAVQELIRLVQPVEPGSVPPSTSDSNEGSSEEAKVRLNGGRGSGRFMIFAWALEQKDEGKRQFEGIPSQAKAASAEAGGEVERKQQEPAQAPTQEQKQKPKSKERLVSDSGLGAVTKRKEEFAHHDEQDLLVPWVLTQPKPKAKTPKTPKPAKAKGGKKQPQQPSSQEGEAGGGEAGEASLEAGMQKLHVQEAASDAQGAIKSDAQEAPVYQRYYHVFRSGELEALVDEAAAQMRVVHHRRNDGQPGPVRVVCEVSGWERGNWWGVWRVEWA
ncbi:tRNA methyltransferase, has a role in tRNA modification [Thecaphora frezii]